MADYAAVWVEASAIVPLGVREQGRRAVVRSAFVCQRRKIQESDTYCEVVTTGNRRENLDEGEPAGYLLGADGLLIAELIRLPQFTPGYNLQNVLLQRI